MKQRSFQEYCLSDAITRGDLKGALSAISHGASPLAKDSSGNDLVLCAAAVGQWDIAFAMLRCGANIEAQFISTGNRLMHLVALNGKWGEACLLICFKASLNPQNLEGHTPLDLAIRGAQDRVREMLIKNHAKANTESSYIRNLLVNESKARAALLYTEETECVCGHGISKHQGARRCNGLNYYSDGYDYDECFCVEYRDVLGRDIKRRDYRYREIFGDYDIEQ
jgi:hypothetical protein